MSLPPRSYPAGEPGSQTGIPPGPPTGDPTREASRADLLDQTTAPQVGLIMGSQSDWQTLSHTASMLDTLEISYEARIISAHRTPDRLADYASTARPRGVRVIIAGAGGAAHLPGMCAAWTVLPVLGVPIESPALRGIDSLLSIVQMPAGVPVATLAIGRAGAVNAGVLAAAILSLGDPDLATRLETWRALQTASVPDMPSIDREPRDRNMPDGGPPDLPVPEPRRP